MYHEEETQLVVSDIALGEDWIMDVRALYFLRKLILVSVFISSSAHAVQGTWLILKSDQNFLTLKSDSEMVIKNFEFFDKVVD